MLLKEEKEKLIYCVFTKSQIHNPRTIVNKDGNKTRLVSVSLPKESKYFGYNVTVEKQFVFSLESNRYLCFISYFYNQRIKITKYNKSLRKYDEIILSAEELKKEFESYKK